MWLKLLALGNLIEWNLSNPDTLGPEESVLISELSSFRKANVEIGNSSKEKCVVFFFIEVFMGSD